MRMDRRKKKTQIKRKMLAIFIIISLVLTLIPIGILGADVSDYLLNKQVVVKQDGKEIAEADWKDIDATKEIEIGFSLRVPVEGDKGSLGIDSGN